MPLTPCIVFVTPAFGSDATGPETYARYLWDAFGEDKQLEFHLVAPAFSGRHPHWHASGPGSGSLDLYRRLAQTALKVADDLKAAGKRVILHVNNSHLHGSLLGYPGTLWGQVNDYENADCWRRAGQTVRQAGWRRLGALIRRRWLERQLIARQDLSLCNSHYTREKILSAYQSPKPERIITLHKAVNLDFFTRPAILPPDPLARPSMTRKFVFVGSDIVRKGLDTLLAAVKALPVDLCWHLTVVGATHAKVVAAFGNQVGVEDPRICYAGALDKDRLRSVLWNSDIFVLPSRAEALGVVLLEALTAGLPVVATRVGGIPEIVSQPAAGILVPADDAKALANALGNVKPWANGRPKEVEAILTSFTTRVMLTRLRELYQAAG